MAMVYIARTTFVPSPLFSDTFNRADSSTSLGTASDGGTWLLGEVNNPSNVPVWGIDTNQAKMVHEQTAFAAETPLAYRAAAADLEMTWVWSGMTVNINQGVVFRMNAALTQFWYVRNNAIGFQGGSSLATGYGYADGDTMRLRAVGTMIQLYRNGSLVFTSTAVQGATFQTNTYAGMIYYGSFGASLAGRYDSITAVTAA